MIYFESLFTHIADGVLLASVDGRILRANPAATRALGREEAELRLLNRGDLVQDVEALRSLLRQRDQHGSANGELTLVRADGSTFLAEITSALIPDAEPPLSYSIFRDISARRAAETALAETHARLDAFMSASPALKWIKRPDGRLVFVNAAWEQAYGRTLDQVRELTESSLRLEELGPQIRADDAQVLATGLPITSVEAHVSAVDCRMHWYQTVRFPITGVGGGLLLGGVASDITAQKHIEEALRASEGRAREAQRELEDALDLTRRTEEKFRQAQKMDAIGRLAGGIAHDFNNLLTVILGNCDMIAEQVTEASLVSGLEEIHHAGQRAATLTKQLLAFSRKQALQPRVLNLNTVLTKMESMFARLLGEDIDLVFLLHPTPRLCFVDAGQIEQVLLNLVVNARDAMPHGGRMIIETANVALDDDYVQLHPGAIAGPHVMLSVSDSGVGMSRQTQSRLFEPFFTTKPAGKGTGLGLSTVYGIVKQSGGTIWVYSEEGQGSTFKVYFPEARGALEQERATPPAREMFTGTETVLLAEDDDAVRATVSGMLRRAGYHVIEAANGGEALLLCEQYREPIHLLVTDVVMPRMNGRQLATRLRQLVPALRVLFMSGYTENVVVHHGVVDQGVSFLQKPVTADVLLPKVREVLAGDV